MSQAEHGDSVEVTVQGAGAKPTDHVYVYGLFATVASKLRLARISPPATSQTDGHWTVVWPIEARPVDPQYVAFIWTGPGEPPNPCSGDVKCLQATPLDHLDVGLVDRKLVPAFVKVPVPGH
jgi:hypothetical protein